MNTLNTLYTCRNCGKDTIRAHAQYCPNCGAPVSPFAQHRRHREAVRLADVPGFAEAVRHYAPRWAQIIK